MRQHMLEVVSRDADVTVVHHHKVIARMAQHLDHVADLAVRTQDLGAHDQADLVVGELRHELTNQRDCLVLERIHAEDDLVLSIVLQAMAAETRVDLAICSLERLQDRGWWSELPCVAVESALELQKAERAPQTQDVVAQSADRANQKYDFQKQSNHRKSSFMFALIWGERLLQRHWIIPESFVTQSLDRIQICRLPRG